MFVCLLCGPSCLFVVDGYPDCHVCLCVDSGVICLSVDGIIQTAIFGIIRGRQCQKGWNLSIDLKT